MVAERVDYPLDELRRFWPDKEAILYDALRYLSQQIDVWRRQLMLDETQTAEQKLLARYQAVIRSAVKNSRNTVGLVAIIRRLLRFIPILATLFINWPISKKARPTISPTNC